MVLKSLPVAFFLLMLMASATTAREWKGIVPLKSTRADVERLLGKPNQLGRYEIENERVNFYYSEGPCDSGDSLAEANCECLVAKDIVLKIVVTFDRGVKVSKLGIDKKKYERTPFNSYRPSATYADFTDGVVYTIVESDDIVTNISYLPSARDCEAIQNHHPENWVEYINATDAITVEAMIENGCEQVISLVYRATSRERQSRCEPKGNNE